jgi:hypothetical protein
MSSATIKIETETNSYNVHIEVKEAGHDPLPMLLYSAFRRFCDDRQEIMEANSITITATLDETALQS